MSPVLDHLQFGLESFPRVSGDEPTLLAKASLKTEFSPRERG